MAKKVVSASIEEETEKQVVELAEKEKRSVSQMIDLLLQIAIPIFKEKK